MYIYITIYVYIFNDYNTYNIIYLYIYDTISIVYTAIILIYNQT